MNSCLQDFQIKNRFLTFILVEILSKIDSKTYEIHKTLCFYKLTSGLSAVWLAVRKLYIKIYITDVENFPCIAQY